MAVLPRAGVAESAWGSVDQSPQPAGRPLPAAAVQRAQLLVGGVRDYEPETVRSVLSGLDRRDLHALAVTLAAMVPVDQSPADLLAWNDAILPPAPPAPKGLAPHGSHSAFNRHRNDGTDPCEACRAGERAYQRNRQRRSRAEERAAKVWRGEQASA